MYSDSIQIFESYQTWAKIKHNLFLFLFLIDMYLMVTIHVTIETKNKQQITQRI